MSQMDVCHFMKLSVGRRLGSLGDLGWARPARVHRENDLGHRQYGLLSSYEDIEWRRVQSRQDATKVEADAVIETQRRDSLAYLESCAQSSRAKRDREREDELAQEMEERRIVARLMSLSLDSGRQQGGYVLNVVPPLSEMEYCEKHDLHRNPKSLRYCWMCREEDEQPGVEP